MIYVNQFNEELPPNIGKQLADKQPVLSLGGAAQIHVKGAKRPAALLAEGKIDGDAGLRDGQAVMQTIERLEEPVTEEQFRSLCYALEVRDEAAIDWGLGWLSSCGFLRD